MIARTRYLVAMGIVLVLAAVGHAASDDPAVAVAADSAVSREAREILDVLYPGTPPPDEAVDVMRRTLLAFHLARVRADLARGRFDQAGETLATAIHGVDWLFSPIDLFQALDGYRPPKPGTAPTDAAAARDVAELRQDYRERRVSALRKLVDTGTPLSFAEIHAWVTEGDGVLSSFLADRADGALSWEVLSRSELADIRSLLKGAKEAETGSGSPAGAARKNLTKSYLRHNLERFVVFDELRQAAMDTKKGFEGFLGAASLAMPLRVVSLVKGGSVDEAIVSFANGLVGNTRTDGQGRARLEQPLVKLVRQVGGDGWIPLSVYRQRVEVLYTNLNANHLLGSATVEPPGQGTGIRFAVPEQTYRVSQADTAVHVKVVCPVPNGSLGELGKVVITLSGQKPIDTVVGGTAEFPHLYAGDYLVSAEGKDEQGVTIKTAARWLTVEPGKDLTITLELPSSDTVQPQDETNLNVVVAAFEQNKDRLMGNKLEVKEYRTAQGQIFKDNRTTLGSKIRDAMAALTKISVGLKYKSEGLDILKRIQALQKQFDAMRTDLPQKLTQSKDLRGNLMQLVEQYSNETFDVGESKGYVFLARFRHLYEQSVSNREELEVTLGRLYGEVRPKVTALRSKTLALMTEYCEKYQLVKFTVGLTYDADVHRLIAESLQPFERLLDEVEQLKANDFLVGYDRQVKQLSRVVENRHATLKILSSNLDKRLERYRDHAKRKLDPLRDELASLTSAGSDVTVLDKLTDLRHFADPAARILPQQRTAFIQTLRSVAESPTVRIPGAAAGPTDLQGTVVRLLADLTPALEFNARMARNQEEGKRLLDEYNDLLRNNLVQLYDIVTPEAEIRQLFTKDRYERERDVNLATGELSKNRMAPDLLLKGVPANGLAVAGIAKDLAGLYILELERRRVRDAELRVRTAEVTKLLEPVQQGIPGALDTMARSLATLAPTLKPPARGGLHFPRLDADVGSEVDADLTALRTGLSAAISDRFREPAQTLAILAEKLDPTKLESEPPQAAMAEAKALLAQPVDPSTDKVVDQMEELGYPVSQSYRLWKTSRARVKEYLEQLGGL